ncbi:Cyanovirin-N [Sphaerosporella brunnea]|uniref:Cyanovirin-N n=1 Tax=Sphaerosporella brunnea TaxID=1250544 RepID=A0A5J5EZR3_9PEZI|nr:Cyanovirin-N [Sphaerosporella brunnea]
MGIRAKTAFSLTATDIRLEDSLLYANLPVPGATETRTSVLDLDAYVGNDDGHFDLMGHSFFESCIEIALKGAVLSAKLRDRGGNYHDAVLNLDFVIINDGGRLRFRRPSRCLELSCCCFSLNGSILEALCLGRDGRLHHSAIDLNKHLANHDGRFSHVREDGNFSGSGNNFSIDFERGFKLEGYLEGCNKSVKAASFDLARIIGNVDGSLVYHCHDGGSFDFEADYAGFYSALPLMGLNAVGIHLTAEDKLEKAAAANNYATIVFGASLVGALMGPGPLGPATGAALATQTAMGAFRNAVASNATQSFVSNTLPGFLASSDAQRYLSNYVCDCLNVRAVLPEKLGKGGRAAAAIANEDIEVAVNRCYAEAMAGFHQMEHQAHW